MPFGFEPGRQPGVAIGGFPGITAGGNTDYSNIGITGTPGMPGNPYAANPYLPAAGMDQFANRLMTQDPNSAISPAEMADINSQMPAQGMMAYNPPTSDVYAQQMQAPPTPQMLQSTMDLIKQWDQSATVREGEMVTIRNAPGIPEVIREEFNRLQIGDEDTPILNKFFMDKYK